MDRTRWILSNLSVVNIILAAVLIVFANNMFLPLFGKSSRLLLPPLKKQAAVSATTAEKPGEGKSPSPSDYFLIAEQNIFHPERKIPVEKKNIVAPPLPKPDFVLYGTLMLDDVRIAYMEDKKAPQTTATRGKKQIPVRVGEALSGFTLKEISADRVVMVRGAENVTVNLNDAAKDRAREQSGGIPVAQHGGPAIQQVNPAATQNQQWSGQTASRRPAEQTATQQAVTQPNVPMLPDSGSPSSNRNAFYRLFNRR